MPYRVPIPNGFTQNSAHGFGSLFPFSVDLRAEGSIHRLAICAQQVTGICDLLTGAGIEMLCVFGVDHGWYDSAGSQALSLYEVVRQYSNTCQPVDAETVIITAEELGQVSAELNHHHLLAFDVRRDWQAGPVLAAVEAIRERRAGQLLLPFFPSARVALSSLDDCHLYVESRDPALLRRMVSRMLQTLAGTLLGQHLSYVSEISEVPEAVIDALLGGGPVTILERNAGYSGGVLRMGVSQVGFKPREVEAYAVDRVLTYQMFGGAWSLERPAGRETGLTLR